MAYGDYIPGNNQVPARLGPAPVAPVGSVMPYQGIPQQVLAMMQPPSRNARLFDQLGLVGSALMAAGAPSLDPGNFGKQMAQLPLSLQNYQRGIMDQKRQAGLFQYQMAQDALARQRAERELGQRDRQIGIEQERLDFQVGQADSPQYGPIEVFEKTLDDGRTVRESAYRDSPAAQALMDDGYNAIKTPASVTNVNIGAQSAGAKKADQVYAEEWVNWVAKGGQAEAEKGIIQLREVQDLLSQVASGESDARLTGQASSVLPPALRAWVNAESADRQEVVEEVVQRNLRVILGAQFTQKEGERLIARAYNPMLSEERNARRLGLLISTMEKMMAAKNAAADYWRNNDQSLAGFEGPSSFGFDELNAALDADDEAFSGGVSDMSTDDLLKSLGLD